MARNTERNGLIFEGFPSVNKERKEHKQTYNSSIQPNENTESNIVTGAALVAQVQGNLAEKTVTKEKISGYIPISLASQFRKCCKKNNSKLSDVLEQLIQLYVSGN